MIQFQPFRSENQEQILSMMKAFYKIDNYPFDEVKANDLLNQFIQNDSLGCGYVIKFNNQISGYFILTYVFSFEYGGRIAFLDELFIDENYRGKGIAGETLTYINELKETLDIKLFYLEVEPHNLAAQNLYKKYHFIIHDRLIMKK